MPKSRLGPGLSRQPTTRATKRSVAILKYSAMAVVMFTAMAIANLPEAWAEPFGQCARQRDVDVKIASCSEASRATTYPSILRWVHRELARAFRRRGEIDNALASYRRSLAAGERASIRQEMEELTTRPM